MKQTAVEHLIEYFEQQLRLQRESKIKYTAEEAYIDALDVCKNAYNTKEKQQIIEAYNEGHVANKYKADSEQYYNEQFNTTHNRLETIFGKIEKTKLGRSTKTSWSD
jgi:hypothetical protein